MVGKVRYNIRTYERADEILRGISDRGSNEMFLRTLVSEVTGNGSYADSLGYRGLRREMHIISGVAAKMLRERRSGLESSTQAAESSEVDEQLVLFS